MGLALGYQRLSTFRISHLDFAIRPLDVCSDERVADFDYKLLEDVKDKWMDRCGDYRVQAVVGLPILAAVQRFRPASLPTRSDVTIRSEDPLMCLSQLSGINKVAFQNLGRTYNCSSAPQHCFIFFSLPSYHARSRAFAAPPSLKQKYIDESNQKII